MPKKHKDDSTKDDQLKHHSSSSESDKAEKSSFLGDLWPFGKKKKKKHKHHKDGESRSDSSSDSEDEQIKPPAKTVHSTTAQTTNSQQASQPSSTASTATVEDNSKHSSKHKGSKHKSSSKHSSHSSHHHKSSHHHSSNKNQSDKSIVEAIGSSAENKTIADQPTAQTTSTTSTPNTANNSAEQPQPAKQNIFRRIWTWCCNNLPGVRLIDSYIFQPITQTNNDAADEFMNDLAGLFRKTPNPEAPKPDPTATAKSITFSSFNEHSEQQDKVVPAVAHKPKPSFY